MLQHGNLIQGKRIEGGRHAGGFKGYQAALCHFVTTGSNPIYRRLNLRCGHIGKKTQTSGVDAQHRQALTAELFNRTQKSAVTTQTDGHTGIPRTGAEHFHTFEQLRIGSRIVLQMQEKLFLKLHINTNRKELTYQPHGAGGRRG